MRIQSLCKLAEGVLVKTRETGPTFLRIRWEVVSEGDGRLVIKEATLCKMHREEIALKFPNSWGCGQFGLHCEFCEGRRPGKTLPGHHRHSICDHGLSVPSVLGLRLRSRRHGEGLHSGS